MIRVFCGYDEREAIGFHAFVQSVLERTSEPVAITPICAGAQRDGSNAFTYSRFLVPYLCHFEGFALWLDGADMLAVGDLAELWRERSGWHAAQVVKHEYRTKHPRKYVGTELEADNRDYPRKNWSSVVLWNCGHYANRRLTPEFVRDSTGEYLHRFAWLEDARIGELPAEWNHLADEFGASTAAKLLHWTAGIPGFYAYRDAPHADEWRQAVRHAQRGLA